MMEVSMMTMNWAAAMTARAIRRLRTAIVCPDIEGYSLLVGG